MGLSSCVDRFKFLKLKDFCFAFVNVSRAIAEKFFNGLFQGLNPLRESPIQKQLVDIAEF
jgi:hypothetical protein